MPQMSELKNAKILKKTKKVLKKVFFAFFYFFGKVFNYNCGTKLTEKTLIFFLKKKLFQFTASKNIKKIKIRLLGPR